MDAGWCNEVPAVVGVYRLAHPTDRIPGIQAGANVVAYKMIVIRAAWSIKHG